MALHRGISADAKTLEAAMHVVGVVGRSAAAAADADPTTPMRSAELTIGQACGT